MPMCAWAVGRLIVAVIIAMAYVIFVLTAGIMITDVFLAILSF